MTSPRSFKTAVTAAFAFLIVLLFCTSHAASLPTTPALDSESIPSSPSNSSDSSSLRMDATTIAKLGAEYKVLRTIKGFFDGGDELIPEVDHFNGRKHQIMLQLQEALLSPGNGAMEVVGTMGVPDMLGLPAEVSLEDDAVPKVMGDFWVYKWRGLRDFMWVYVSVLENVEASGWHITYM
ncbi:hypothetical protein HK102_007196 [Quaeritorhiza haematococci]|nr:hypothetical protein HK102_007196 [Quaeritorhiza haematococci]